LFALSSLCHRSDVLAINGVPEKAHSSSTETESKLEKVLNTDISFLKPNLSYWLADSQGVFDEPKPKGFGAENARSTPSTPLDSTFRRASIPFGGFIRT
jgi:hypothetical protein